MVEQSRARDREAQFQIRIIAAIATAADPRTVLPDIAAGAVRFCRAHIASIGMLTDTGEEIETVATFGTNAPVLGERVPVEDSLCGLVAVSGRSVRMKDAVRDRRPVNGKIVHQTGTRGLLAVPLRRSDGPFGVLIVAKRIPWHFGEHHEGFLRQLADKASIAIQLAPPCNRCKAEELPARSSPRISKAPRYGPKRTLRTMVHTA